MLAVPSHLGYPVLFALIFGESAGVPLPGETALLTAGVLAGAGRLSLPLVIAVAVAAAVSGDTLGYWLGRRGGRAVLDAPRRPVRGLPGSTRSSAASASSTATARRPSSSAASSPASASSPRCSPGPARCRGRGSRSTTCPGRSSGPRRSRASPRSSGPPSRPACGSPRSAPRSSAPRWRWCARGAAPRRPPRAPGARLMLLLDRPAASPSASPRPTSAGGRGSSSAPRCSSTVGLRLPYIGFPLGTDEGGVAFIAKAWGTGHGSLYGAYWLDRPPLLVALYKLAVPADRPGSACSARSPRWRSSPSRPLVTRAVAGERAARIAAVLSAGPGELDRADRRVHARGAAGRGPGRRLGRLPRGRAPPRAGPLAGGRGPAGGRRGADQAVLPRRGLRRRRLPDREQRPRPPPAAPLGRAPTWPAR